MTAGRGGPRTNGLTGGAVRARFGVIVVRVCTGLASLALACILIAIGLSLWNHSLRVRVEERQQIINRAVTLGQISSRLASGLATVAARDRDEQIMKLLAEHGISISGDATNEPPRPARR